VLRTGRSRQTLGSAIYGRVLIPLPEDQSSEKMVAHNHVFFRRVHAKFSSHGNTSFEAALLGWEDD